MYITFLHTQVFVKPGRFILRYFQKGVILTLVRVPSFMLFLVFWGVDPDLPVTLDVKEVPLVAA
jgi:hypothetical protein